MFDEPASQRFTSTIVDGFVVLTAGRGSALRALVTLGAISNILRTACLRAALSIDLEIEVL